MKSIKIKITENHIVSILLVSLDTHFVGMTELSTIPYVIKNQKVTLIFQEQVTE